MTNTAVPNYFLQTKLYRSPLPDDHIQRPRLLAQLNYIVQQPLTILTAPAGYGKTTLASAWVAQIACPSAWVSLDEGDNDLVVFLGYIVTAIREIFPDFGTKLLEFAHAATLPPLPTLTSYLLHEIDQLKKDFVLVLDDFHVLTNLDIYEVLNGVLSHPQPYLHLTLTSRLDPPLQLVKLRAQGRLTELCCKDLRFSAEEVANFTKKALPAISDPETIRILTEKTEGWPVGLRLATLAIRRWGMDDYQPSILQVDNQYVIDYLVSEVLARQSTAVRDFLLKSSILDRFCAPLCAVVMDSDLSEGMLTQLEREGLFIESLDSHNEWYRYHQLFRDLLRHRLEEEVSANEIATLHLRASGWLAANGFLEDAITHALASGDVQAAATVLSKQSRTLITQERWLLLESLINKFPPEVINQNVNLLLMLAWLDLTRAQMGHMVKLRELLETHAGVTSLTPEEAQFMDCSLHIFAAIRDNWAADYENAILHAQAALDIAQPEWGVLRMYIWTHLGTATHYLKGGQAGLAVLTADEPDIWLEPAGNRLRKQLAIGFVNWISADLGALLQTAVHGFELAHGLRWFTSVGMLHYYAGSAHYERNDLDAASEHFNIILTQRYAAQPAAYLNCLFGQALVYQVQNMVDEAWELAETAVQYTLEIMSPALQFTATAFQADLALRQGDLGKARYWVEQVEVTMLPQMMPFLFQEQMIFPKLLLAEGTPASYEQAEAELVRLHDIVTSTHNTRFQIEVLAMQALLYQAQDKLLAAEESLLRAIWLAQHGGFIRLFVDLGPKMALLLKHLYTQGQYPAYIRQILEAFPAASASARIIGSEALVESLTDREMEVLELLSQRLSNKEIAKMLVIAPETVKRHTINIYQKLGVNGRREAVAKANALNLFVDVL